LRLEKRTSAMTFKPVTQRNWKDFEKLFESKGAPGYCWCMVWRDMLKGGSRSDNAAKKSSIKNFVANKSPIGILCYDKKEPVAWCSIAPRESYRELGGDQSLNNVWSLVCFYIKKEYRDQGLSQAMVKEAMKYAKSKGATYIEAYPVDPDSPSYRFGGFKTLFEKSGFEFRHKAGSRRNVMVKKL
jgi:GNAT superfamily N-acetyltransferase